jgi:hypothetical protein
MTERQAFRVVRSYPDFEVREYEPCVLAEVKVSADYTNAGSRAFSNLFNYISKGNNSSTKIAMTAPVIAAQKAEKITDDEWFVSFVMPSGSKIGHLPHPSNAQVKLRELDSETCIAISFKGKATKERADLATKTLRAAAARENIALSHETRICHFDPPFKPGFMQYNEIVITVYMQD